MADKARHAFGRSEGIDNALQNGIIDAYDILFLDGDSNMPKVGWIDKNGNKVIVEDKEQVVHVDVLPEADGDQNVIYIFEDAAYIWNGTECIPLSKDTDLSELENEVANKVDAATVETMIEEAVAKVTAVEVVEF
jgi:hypothetical protein